MIQAVGKITVTVAGVPVIVSTGAALSPGRYACHEVLIQALPTNVGKVYIGTATMNKATFTNLFAVLAVPTANQIPTFSAALTLSAAAIDLTDLYIDADAANDGVIVTVLIT